MARQHENASIPAPDKASLAWINSDREPMAITVSMPGLFFCPTLGLLIAVS